MIYPHTIRYGQSNQPGEYDVAHDPTYIYIYPRVPKTIKTMVVYGRTISPLNEIVFWCLW